MGNRDVTAANAAKYADCIPREELREELERFRTRWILDRRFIARILDMPETTIMAVFNDHRSPLVMKETANKIRKGIRDYDSRTCIYRKIRKTEVSKWLQSVQKKHEVSWNEVAEMVDYPVSKIWQINCNKSEQKYVKINDMRHMMIAYNEWIKRRADIWSREGVA